MAEFPGGMSDFVTTKKCNQCGIKPAVFLHHVLHKGQLLQICTSCVLQLHQGYFCPICFIVYDDQFNLSKDNHVKCTTCENTFHLSCIRSIPSFSNITTADHPTGVAAAACSSSSPFTAVQNYCISCPRCVDQNRKFVEFNRDDTTGNNNAVMIDMSSAAQLVAAAEISMHSMNKASKIASVRAQIMCKEAAEARKEAKDALEKLHDLTLSAHYDTHQNPVEENTNGSQENLFEEDQEEGGKEASD